MKLVNKAIIAASLVFSSYAMAGMGRHDDTPEINKMINMSEVVVSKQLLDPDSAKFSGSFINIKEMLVCGSVNAKNSFGGYTGEKLYVLDLQTGVAMFDTSYKLHEARPPEGYTRIIVDFRAFNALIERCNADDGVKRNTD